MTAELHHLEREAHDFDVRKQDTKDAIEEIWLVELLGKGTGAAAGVANERQRRRALTTSAGPAHPIGTQSTPKR